jgi:hypothetical protein
VLAAKTEASRYERKRMGATWLLPRRNGALTVTGGSWWVDRADKGAVANNVSIPSARRLEADTRQRARIPPPLRNRSGWTSRLYAVAVKLDAARNAAVSIANPIDYKEREYDVNIERSY